MAGMRWPDFSGRKAPKKRSGPTPPNATARVGNYAAPIDTTGVDNPGELLKPKRPASNTPLHKLFRFFGVNID